MLLFLLLLLPACVYHCWRCDSEYRKLGIFLKLLYAWSTCHIHTHTHIRTLHSTSLCSQLRYHRQATAYALSAWTPVLCSQMWRDWQKMFVNSHTSLCNNQNFAHTSPVELWKLQLHAGNICIYCGVGKNTYEYSDKHFGVLRH